MKKSYTLAIADNPCVIRRDSEKVAGDVAIGFGFSTHPLASATETHCNMIGCGDFTFEMFMAMLNAMSDRFTRPAVAATVAYWLREGQYAR